MPKAKKKKAKKTKPVELPLTALAKFLKSRGWYVVVIGGGIRQGPALYNYELVVNFTGYKTGAEKEDEPK